MVIPHVSSALRLMSPLFVFATLHRVKRPVSGSMQLRMEEFAYDKDVHSTLVLLFHLEGNGWNVGIWIRSIRTKKAVILSATPQGNVQFQ
jgi:hypothetical protein